MNILTEVEERLSIFKNFYDIIRVIDPIKKTVIGVKYKVGQELNFQNHSCFLLWEKGESCENCISMRAFLEENTFMKIENVQGEIFFVTASPIIVGQDKYIVELLKDVTVKGIDTVYDNKCITNMGNLIYKLNQCAIKDSLTDTFNRRYISEQLTRVIKDNSKNYTPLSLVIIDIDHFKEINDSYGHVAGDYVLREFSKLVMEFIGETSYWLGRYGGDEFVLVLNNTNEVEAFNIASEIKESLEKKDFIFEGEIIKTTGSFGVCTLREKGVDSVEKFINCADRALYMAKQQGRNKVEVTKI